MTFKVVVTAAFVAVLSVLGAQALAHSWYPPECCSDRDCSPFPAKDVVEQPDGWRLSTGEFVERGKEKISRDEDYHLCRLTPSSPIICFFVPPRGA